MSPKPASQIPETAALRCVAVVRQRTRAVDEQDREQRRLSILNAAEKLFAKSPDNDISVAQVAELAGLAKGTIYLYFESKEVLLLSLHERRVQAFFFELLTALDAQAVFGFEQMAAIVRRHMTEEPLYMALGAVAMRFMDRQTAPAALKQLSDQIAAWMLEAGAKLEQKVSSLAPGQGVRLLLHGYAQIVGLWHLLAVPSAVPSKVAASVVPPAALAARQALGPLNYADEAEYALAQLWTSALAATKQTLSTKKVSPT